MNQVQVPPPPTTEGWEQHLRQPSPLVRRPWWQMKRFIIPLMLVVLGVMVGVLSDPPADEQAPVQLATGDEGEPEVVALVAIPDVSGMDRAEAREVLREAGLLRFRAVKQESDEPEGTVLGTNPAAGEEIEPGTRIDLLIADLSAEAKAAAAAEREAEREREEAELRAEEERQAEEARKELEAEREREEAELRAEEERQAEEARKEQESRGTVAQANAVRSAESYLDFSGFSRSGLIEQLEYEGYSREQAEYGATQVGL